MRAWIPSRKARAFTLVEILIVIIIVGILAGMMMLVSMSATQKAEATRISGEIRSMKAAALFYYNDEGEWPDWSNTAGTPEKYLEGKPVFANYWLGVIKDTASDDRVAVVLAGSSLDVRVRKHLADMAREMGYYVTGNVSDIPDSGSLTYFGQNDSNLICFICPD